MSFTESATLRILDQSTGPLKKINTALETVFRTAERGRSIRIALRTDTREVDTLQSRLQRLEARARRPIQVAVNTAGLASATRDMDAYARAAQRAAAAMQRATGVASGMRPPSVPLVPPGIGYGGRQPVNHGWFGRYPENIPGIAARYAAYRTVQYGHDATRAGGAGILEGATQRSVTALDQNFAAKAIGAAVDDGSQRYGYSTRAYLTEQVRQLASQIPKRPDGSINEAEIAGLGAPTARLIAGLGLFRGDTKEAERDANFIRRGLDAIGRADNAGKYSDAVDFALAGAMQGGSGWKGQNYEAALKHSGRAKFSMNNQMLVDLAGLTDEYASYAGAMLRMGVGDLTRGNLHDNKKALMIDAGLRNADGKANPKVAEEAATNYIDFTLKRLKPLVEKWIGVKPGQLDPENPEQRSKISAALGEMGFNEGALKLAEHILSKEKEVLQWREGAARKLKTLGWEQINGEWTRTGGDGQFLNVLKGDLTTRLPSVQTSWKNLSDSFTQAIGAQGAVTAGANWLSASMEKARGHPGVAGVALAAGTVGAWAVNNLGHVALGVAAYKLGGAAGLLSLAARGLMVAGAAGKVGALAPLAGLAAAGAAGSRVAGLAGAMGGTAAGAAGGAASAGLLARLMGRWGGLGGLGKLGLVGGGIGGIASLLTGDWLGAAGGAMTVGGLLMGGPIGGTIAALGALASVWPLLKDFLFGTAANAAEVGNAARGMRVPETPQLSNVAGFFTKLRSVLEDTDMGRAIAGINRWLAPKAPGEGGIGTAVGDAIRGVVSWLESANAQIAEANAQAAKLRKQFNDELGAQRQRVEESKGTDANDIPIPPTSHDRYRASREEQFRRIEEEEKQRQSHDDIWRRIQGWGFDKPPGGEVPGMFDWLKNLNPFKAGDAGGGDLKSAFEGAGEPIRVAGHDVAASIQAAAPSITAAGQAASAGWYEQLVSAGSALGAAAAAQISAARVEVNVNAPPQAGRGSVGAPGVTNV